MISRSKGSLYRYLIKLVHRKSLPLEFKNSLTGSMVAAVTLEFQKLWFVESVYSLMCTINSLNLYGEIIALTTEAAHEKRTKTRCA